MKDRTSALGASWQAGLAANDGVARFTGTISRIGIVGTLDVNFNKKFKKSSK